MDVGMTKSGRSSPFHYFTGTIVFLVGYSAAMLFLRDLIM